MPSFLKRWLGGHDEGDEHEAKPCLPEGERVYCIGDIHGRLDLLRQLHQLIIDDAAGFAGSKKLIYLGDYIDRGEQSKQVIDLLLEEPLGGFEPVHLLGNHEQSLLDFLQHPWAVAAWLSYGGRAALQSYGVELNRDPGREDIEALRDELEYRLPRSHLEFFRRLQVMHQVGNYCFVHAGIRPGVPLQEQRNEDLLWIREDFTGSVVRHGSVVVHGHSITPEVDWRPNRIGIDTGAFHSGVLTCLVLEGTEQRVLQTVPVGNWK